MAQAQWQLQTAKAQFSEVVDAALRGEPQRVTRRGKDAVMVLSEQEYLALKTSAKRDAPDFISYLLAMPKQPKQQAGAVRSAKPSEARLALKLRDIEL